MDKTQDETAGEIASLKLALDSERRKRRNAESSVAKLESQIRNMGGTPYFWSGERVEKWASARR